MQLGFYFDQSRCSNCLACVVACKDWNDIPSGDVFWRWVITIEEGEFPNLDVSFLSASCYHCEDAPCIAECPVEAITKRDSDGIVVVDSDACLGRDQCGVCRDACPYGAPRFGHEADSKMQKCNFCLERIDAGVAKGLKPGVDREATPACVNTCQGRALTFGDLDDPDSEVRRLIREKRAFQLHPDYDTDPSIYYIDDGRIGD